MDAGPSPSECGEAAGCPDPEKEAAPMNEAGSDDDERRSLSRRRFLSLAAGGVAVGGAATMLGPVLWDQLSRAAAASGSPGTIGSTSGRTLVLVTLYGGNDGLNTVIPYKDPSYAPARGILAVDPTTVLDLGDGIGLHPAMPRFHKLWAAKHLAIVQGVGFANPNYSHFASMDIWQTAQPQDPSGTGWLGRWMDKTGADPLRAVAIGPTVPTLLSGAKVQAAAIAPGPIQLPGSAADVALYRTLATTSRGEAALLAQAAHSNADLLDVNKVLGPVLAKTAHANPLHLTGAEAPDTSGSAGALAIANGGGGLSAANVLSTQLSVVANLLLADVPTEVFSVELGGFDTHTDQVATQAELLPQLDTAVGAFLDAIGHTKRGKETVVLVYTEFGRRVSANASAGTDHGWANVIFAAGDPVKGGFYGEPPSLTNLSEGNQIYNLDFRRVYATVLDQVIGVDAASFLGGKFSTVAFV
jgi:uncharacterized protein (DUF1501 family)